MSTNREQLSQLIASPRLLTWVLLAPLLLAAAFQLFKAGPSVFFRGDNTFPEGAVVQTAVWSAETGRVYPSLDQSPYTPAPYGPLFYLGLSVMARAAHANFDQTMMIGRSLILINFLMLSVIAYLWTRRRGLPPAFGVIAGVIILAQIDFLDWNVSVRPDLAALMLGFVAFYLLTADAPSQRALLLAGAFCGAAALVKQSFIALPFVGVIWLLSTRRIRQAIVFALGGIVLSAVIVGYLAAMHEPFLQEVLLARYSPVSAAAGFQLLAADLLHYPWQICFLVLAVLGALWIPKEDPLRRMLLLYLLFAWLAGIYTAMAPGANVNAFLEPWVLCAVLATLALYRVSEKWKTIPGSFRFVLLVVWLAASLLSLNSWRYSITTRPTGLYGELADLAAGRRVLSDFPYVTVHGVKPELLDPSVNHYLELAHHWSPQPVLGELRTQQFDLVILGLSGGQPRQWRGLTLFSNSILQEVAHDYRLACASGHFAVYEPGNRVVLNATDAVRLRDLGCKTATHVPPQR